ncbi:MAG: AIPR family protein [Planctomycetales bacterium]|nr:AIPR family protein [Planctomycetales bacterium]
MTKQKTTFLSELKKELSEIDPRYGKLPDEDRFVMWFLLAEWGASEEEAANAITNGSNDKGIDALLIDETSRTVCVVQGKYRQKVGEKSEGSKDVDELFTVVQLLTQYSDNSFNEWIAKGDLHVKRKLRDARTRVMKDGYRIKLYFVTLGKFTPTVQKNVETKLRSYSGGDVAEVFYELFDGKRCAKLWAEWEGGGPLPPTLELEMADAPNVTNSGTLQRHDKSDEIETWVFAMRGDKIAELYHLAKERLFAWNVRGDAGVKTPANRQMQETLEQEPERFFYYNNGITMLCENAMQQSGRGANVLRVTKPQVINGQQTTRTLYRALMKTEATKAKVAKASVLVKVICVRGREDEYDRIEGLRSKIITGTNRQTAITLADLKANDKRQIVLEKSLKRMNYEYLRKKRASTDARSGKHFHCIHKEAFAQAVAACDDSPALARTSKVRLFQDDVYVRMFPNDDPFYYLTRYWLMHTVGKTAKAWEQNKQEPKWMVLNFVWSKLRSRVNGSRGERFCDLCRQRDEDFLKPFSDAIKKVFLVGLRFYEANCGPAGQRIDIETFYKNASKADAGAFREFFKASDRESQAFGKYFDKAIAVLME